MEDMIWLEDIEVGANIEVLGPEPTMMKCTVSIPKLMLSESTVILPKLYSTSCLTIVPFHQSSNLKVHIACVHTACEQRRFVGMQ